MSDTPQGPDWWQASDDKWYPPPRPEMPGDPGLAPVGPPEMPPPGAPPAGPPVGPPTGPPSGGFPPGPPSGGFPAPGPASPYGGMPPGTPPGGQQNRTPLYVAIGVVVAAALVALIVVLSGDDDGGPTTGTTNPRPPSTDEPTDTTGDDPTDTTDDDGGGGQASGGEVELIDSGFSNFMGGFDGDERSGSYGFIVENTSDETVTDVSVSVSVFDADGNVLTTDSHTIWVLRPDEKLGMGDVFWGGDLTAEIADVQIQVSEPSDYPSDVPDEGTLTAEGVTTVAEEYGGLKTTFTVKSTYGEQIDGPYAYAVYKDASGKIVGGSYGILDFVPANGTSAGEINSFETVPDVATTEVYLDPGYVG